ncbi:50S ribosomal protein L10 [Candidatus Uhrbacteria bacterium]|nr:50S ribosomal protein L10 [Candidatus Uhrbacteria bacterium]
MPKTRSEKEAVVEELAKELAAMRSVVFADYQGLKTKEIEALRSELKKEGIGYTVAKKTLLALALREAGLALDPQTIEGNFATIISPDDEVAPARLAAQFAKEHEALKILGGILEAKFIDASGVIRLAKLPSKQELLARIAGSLNAPISGLVRVLAGNFRSLLTVLSAMKETKTI